MLLLSQDDLLVGNDHSQLTSDAVLRQHHGLVEGTLEHVWRVVEGLPRLLLLNDLRLVDHGSALLLHAVLISQLYHLLTYLRVSLRALVPAEVIRRASALVVCQHLLLLRLFLRSLTNLLLLLLSG